MQDRHRWTYGTISTRYGFPGSLLPGAAGPGTFERLPSTRFGALLESFVVSELLKLASWSERRSTFAHYRTKDQDEVDIVIPPWSRGWD
ncbi:DUF4143 domain-containing protein [Agrobacterium tumefaciens]|uniref:DUF4143 domain-containing protein n=1 Tax=Agrobacterium tumefaciens TaxID=358 RepID=UPI0027D8DECB|nr:DUF4143 domain-containing protein [Agrobacterium tumefaciens]